MRRSLSLARGALSARPSTRARLAAAALLAISASLLAPEALAAQLDITTASIAELQAAMKAGLSSEALVNAYLARIKAYEDAGPKLNAIILLNAEALKQAKALDQERKSGKLRGPLHGVPIVLKDNFDTFDMPTTAGSMALKDSTPPDDAFVVRKLREAGAIILAKTNLSEFASTANGPDGFSSLGGQTLNPHDLTKGPRGSSGGSGAGIAAGYAQFGLGTDTGGSVRYPCSANGIAGLKPTRGLMSRDGIVPLALSYDTGGPMARSVADVAMALGVMTGVDPADAATAPSAGQFKTDYTQYLVKGSLKGARIGVARDFMGQDAEVDKIMDASYAKLKALGATVVEVKLPEMLTKARADLLKPISGREFKAQIGVYLQTLKPGYPKSLAEMIAKLDAMGTAYTNPWRLANMKEAEASTGGLEDPIYKVAKNEGLALVTAATKAVFQQQQLDALVYPTMPMPATPFAAPTPDAPRPQMYANLANQTGFPDLIVPAGMTSAGLPVTLSFLGLAWSEPKLFGYGYDFEQATQARVLPKHTPALKTDVITY